MNITFRDDAEPGAIEALEDGLRELPGLIPEIRSYSFGRDRGLVPTNGDFAIVADFDDVDGWQAYQDHPAHVRMLRELLPPVLYERVAVQLDVDG